MNIWLINPFDELPGEGPAQRYATLARRLASRGHHVLWISCSFRHRTKATSPLPSRDFQADGFRVVLVNAPAYRRNLSMARLFSHGIWAWNVHRLGRREVDSGQWPRPDLILASSPPLEGAWAARRLGRRFCAKTVVDLQDDWPAAWQQAVPAHPLPRALAQGLFFPWTLLSRWNMRHADAVSAQSRFFAERAMSQGAGDRPHICYLGTEARPTKSAPPDTPFTLLYLGSMGRFYDLETVLQAARRAKDAGKSWLWRLVGTDPNRRWQARTDALGLSDKVAFPGYMQGDVLEHALASSHAALIPMDPRSQVAVPGKAATYASAGLPMISSLPGELASLLSSYDAGCTYCHGNAVDLFQKIASLAETDGQRKRQSEGARRLFADHFDAAKTYEAFADWIESTANTA